MKNTIKLILILLVTVVTAQENPSKFIHGLQTIPTDSLNGVPTLGQVMDSISTNASTIWDLDTSLNLSLKDVSGLNNTGNSSILMGSGAGNNNTAWGTIGIGYETVQDVDFNYNIGIGTYAGKSINSGDNTAIGTSAGENYQGENGHAVLIGSNAGKEAKQYAGGLIAIGRNAAENFGGTSNADQDAVIIGHNAGQNGKNLWRGVFIGLESGQEYGGTTAESGIMNTAIGAYTLKSGQGQNNTAIGYSAFRSGSGNNNVAIGSYWVSSAGGTPLGAGRDMVGDNNTIVGGWNGVSLQGNNNIQIGFEQAHSTKGNYNTIIGGGRELFNDTGNYRVSIGSHFGSAVRLQTNDVAIGRNTPIFVRDNKLGVGLNTSNGTPAVPREKLDIGDNGTMIGEGVKYVGGSNSVFVRSSTLTSDRVQQLQDENGTIALIETSGTRTILPIESSKGIALPAMLGTTQEDITPIDLFDFCPSVDLDYIDWEITWKDRDTMFKATALGDYNLQLTWSSESCFQITGQTMSTVQYTLGDVESETKLILYY